MRLGAEIGPRLDPALTPASADEMQHVAELFETAHRLKPDDSRSYQRPPTVGSTMTSTAGVFAM